MSERKIPYKIYTDGKKGGGIIESVLYTLFRHAGTCSTLHESSRTVMHYTAESEPCGDTAGKGIGNSAV